MARQRGAVGGGVLLGLLALVVAGRADEAAAVKAVEKLGGRVIVDTKRPGKPVVGVDLDRTKVTDADLKELKELKSLRKLDLTGTKVTDAGVKELKVLKSLEVLFLTGTKVTDEGVKELKAALSGLLIVR
jgi:internalin A